MQIYSQQYFFNNNNLISTIMQDEDDLRGLDKLIDFMRALSILFVVINVYWFWLYSVNTYFGTVHDIT